MFKKKAVAMFLAFTFIIGYIPQIGLIDVFAAGEQYPDLLQEGHLSIKTNNDTPEYSDQGQNQSSFMFGWQVDTSGETSTLEYWVKEKVKMQVTTRKDGDDVFLDIALLDTSTSPYTPISVRDAKYTVYNNQEKQYLTVDKFFTPSGSLAYNDFDHKEVLDSHNPVGGTTSTSASFRLTNTSSDAGYSIMYNDYDLRFLLDTNGYFRFYQVGGLSTGRIYDTEFTITDTTGTSTTYDRAFSIGLDLDKVSTQPFVDVDNAGTLKEYESEKYNIEDRGLVSVDDNDGVGFDYFIKLPYEYDEATNTFTSLTQKDANYKVVFSKGNTSSPGSAGNYISLSINVPAGGGTPTVTSSTFANKDATCVASIDTATNTLKLEIAGLDSGMLLSPNVTFSLADSANAVVKNYGTVDTKAYTFPEYEIINNDGTDYVSITPFEGYAGDYVLYSATCNTPVNKSDFKYSARFFKENPTSTDKVWLPLSPVPASGEVKYDYKLFFNPNNRFTNPGTIIDNTSSYGKVIKSRYFEYTAKDRGTIGFPNNFEITDVNQSKMFTPDTNYTADGSGNYVEDFKDTSYTLGWDLGKVSSIDRMLSSDSAVKITYKVNIGEEIDVVDTDFLTINFYVDGSGGPNNAVLNATTPFDFTFGKNGTSNGKTFNNVIDARLTTVYSTQSSAYVYRLEIDLENVAIDVNKKADHATVAQQLYFEYPNIYFFTVSPILASDSGSITSTVKSLTLNKDTSVELREPIKIKTSNMVTQFIGELDALGQAVVKDQVSLDLTYEQQQATLAEFMNYYFTNYDLSHYGQNMQFTNDIYISQNYDMMSKIIPDYTKEERDNISEELVFDGSKNSAGNYTVMMREFSANPAGSDPAPLKTADGKLGIDVLREDGVIRISDVPMMVNEDGSFTLPTSNVVNTLQINGLDTNAKYYFYVDTNVIYESNGHYRYLNQKLSDDEILEETSGVSALTSGTTGSSLQTPSILDEVPTMPDTTLIETGRNNYKMTWEPIDMTISDPNKYSQEFQYEVLRIRDSRLADKYLDSRQDLKEVFANQIDSAIEDKSAQLLFRNEDTGLPDVLLYDHKVGSSTYNTFIEPEVGLFEQKYDEDGNIIYDDNSLSANKVYFVYTRTVRVITDKTTGKEYKVYSPWDVLSATTVLGDAPIDLKVIYNYPGKYDPQTQIPLSFRAKVPTLGDIGKDITFEVTYKYDDKDWVVPITIDSNTLINSASEIDAEGYRTFTFLLSNLAPGKSYSIKVRQANSDGSYTIYSNIVQWKTEIDEDEYDKDDELGAFEDLMDDEVDKLIDGSQVILENNKDEKIIMINGNNLANEITNSTANTITINSFEKGKDNIILIPFEAYQTANNKGMAWQFAYPDMYFNWSAKTIDPSYNTNVIKLNKKIEQDAVEDYYMEIVFDYQRSQGSLGSDQVLTDVVKISTNLKATTENVIDFQEAELKATLEEVKNLDQVKAKKQAVLDKIAKGMVAEDALKLVYEYVDYVNNILQDRLQAKLSAIGQTRDDEAVDKLDKSIVMGTNYQNVLSKVTAYQVNGSLAVPMPTTRTTNATTAMVKSFGTYGFGGNVVNIQGEIPNQSGTNNVSNIIAVNDLEDTMSNAGSIVDTSSAMTVSQAITAMSNMTGMTDSEIKSLLNDKGVTINRNNESKNLTQDLGVAMVAVLYEQINGVNPDQIAIKDYNFYNSLTTSGINSGYIKHIQLAKEVGIITSVPSKTKAMTVGEFLGMLSKI